MQETHLSAQRFTRAWLLLCAALAVHIADEARHGFLGLWNPTVRHLRARHPWLVLPTFTFPVWISLLALGLLGFLIVTRWVRRGLKWTVYAAYGFAFLMLSNAVAHLAFSIYKQQWMPGAETSPLLLIASLYLWIQAKR